MTIEAGTAVRTLVELVADDDSHVIPENSRGEVIGYQGDRLVLEFFDHETGTTTGATANVWEVRAISRPIR